MASGSYPRSPHPRRAAEDPAELVQVVGKSYEFVALEILPAVSCGARDPAEVWARKSCDGTTSLGALGSPTPFSADELSF
eukprot:10451424-Heterocapsa_arctica.AAC.1